MAWTGKVDPKELIGMTPEELKEMRDKVTSYEAKFGELADLIKTQNTGITELSESVKAIKVTSPYSEPVDHNKNNSNELRKLTEWGDDADKAFGERITPLANLTLDTRGALARRSIQDEVKDNDNDWHLFAAEIDDLAKNESPQSKAQEGFWRNVYYVVKGKHANEIAQDRINKTGKFYTESANSITLQKEEKKTPEESLTDEQKKYASKMGVSLKDYATYAQEQGAR